MGLGFLCSELRDSPELQDFLESRNGHVVSLEDSSTLGDILDIGYVPPTPLLPYPQRLGRSHGQE